MKLFHNYLNKTRPIIKTFAINIKSIQKHHTDYRIRINYLLTHTFCLLPVCAKYLVHIFLLIFHND